MEQQENNKETKSPSKKINKKTVRKCFIFVLAALILEIFVFNIGTFMSLGYKETKITDYKLSDSIKKYNENTIVLINKDSSDKYYFEIENINKTLKNIFIDIENANLYFDGKIYDKTLEKININIYAKDEGNSIYYRLPPRSIVSGVERSKYIKMDLSGKCTSLKIKLDNPVSGVYTINGLAFNKTVPFRFNILRFLLILAILIIGYVIRPSSPYYSVKTDLSAGSPLRTAVTVALLINIITIILGIGNMTDQNAFPHHAQYQKLTDALLDHRFYISEAPDYLKEMSNPYDKLQREQIQYKIYGDEFYKKVYDTWDIAYYKGKMYVYFGITPVLLFFLPYKVITGMHIPNYVAIVIGSAIFAAGIYCLVNEIIKRWFRNTSFILYMIMCQLAIYSSGTATILRTADLYHIPIVFGLALTVWGLCLWFKAVNGAKHKALCLFFGSVCMALVAGSRPQMLICSFLAIPLFWNMVFKERKLFSRSSIKETILFMLPYVVFGAFMMHYNYARFGSVFDFGANYNITTNDMTKRGFHINRIGLGLFSYLIQLPVFTAYFPYLEPVTIRNEYMGVTVNEAMMGGLFALQPICLLTLLTFKLKNKLKEKGAFGFMLCLLAFGIIVPVADTQMSGILLRYFGDFSLIWLLGSSICLFALAENIKSSKYCKLQKYLHCFVIAALVIGLYSNLASYLNYVYDNLNDNNPDFFYSIKYFIEFWK